MTRADYIAKIAVLDAENAELRAQVARIPILEAENVQLRSQVLGLENKLIELSLKVERLLIRKDSSNSSLAPSRDLFKKNQSLRTSSGRKVGAQQGHKGKTLEMVEKPDHVKAIIAEYCNICSSKLDGSQAVLVERRQVVDIPPIKAEVTEYQAFAITCACGHYQVGDFPSGVDNHIQYGPNIAAMAVYHNVYQYVAFKRLRDFFVHICNLPISIGTLENMVVRMADKARPIWEEFRQAIEQSKVVGSDETSAKVNSKKHWIWVWQSAFITFLAVSASRGCDMINAMFPNGFPTATLSTDRWKAQLKTHALHHQLCLAHLLRDLVYLGQIEKTPWADQFKELLLDAIQLKKTKSAYLKDDPKVREIEQRLDRLLMEHDIDENALKTITFRDSMLKHQKHLLPFLYNSNVTYDNNASERSIRNVKVKLKVSGQFKSRQEEYCILRSVIDTTIKNGNSVFGAISALAHLKMPPKAAV